MTDFNLYKRMMEFGTLTEIPSDVPDPRFALPSTVNWMRALAILVEDREVNFKSASTFYKSIQRRTMADKEINTICEQLPFSLNQLAALRAMSSATNKADVARMAIVSWYYGVYASATAMNAGADGSFQETHMATAQQWDRQFASNRLVMEPFSDRLAKLDKATIDREMAGPRARGKHSLTTEPMTPSQARGCCAEYLSGTATWEQWNVRTRLKEHRDFKALGKDDFRSAPARELRDSWYERRSISFLHQASRYRGKANYRDSVYLAYGKSVPKTVEGLVDDLMAVLKGVCSMAGGYASVRLGRELWEAYLADIEGRRSISVDPREVWA